MTPLEKVLKPGLKYEQRIMLLAILAALPGALIAMLLLWNGDYTPKVRWTLSLVIIGCWWGFSVILRERVVFHLQTLANLLAALREGDYSIRARGARRGDVLGEVVIEVNALGETLREQRLDALEASALLRKVMAEIDVAVFAFDSEQRLRLINRAGERLLAQPSERILGLNVTDVGLQDCLDGETSFTSQRTFPGGAGRWEIRRSTFREHGLPNYFVVISDLSRVLREEERQAWQRLVRVLGHELNNSLAPIKSIAGSLENLLLRTPRADDWEEDMRGGLSIISARAEALNRFMGAYARLARLPQPRLQTVDVGKWIRRIVGLETRINVVLLPGPELEIEADGDQLDQLLINLVRNAVDASLETGGGVRISWTKAAAMLDVLVEDDGMGLANTNNLFVPFFTTKPEGSGIGLVLSRQIAEGHGGFLTLENRKDGRGCEARLRLPLFSATAQSSVL